MKIKLSDPQQRLIDLIKIANLCVVYVKMTYIDEVYLENIENSKRINRFRLSISTVKSLIKAGVLVEFERKNYTEKYRLSENYLKSIEYGI